MIEYSEATLRECNEILSNQENLDSHLWENLVNNINIDEDILIKLLNTMPMNCSDYMECIVRHKSADVKIFKEVLKREDNCINSLVLHNIASHHNADVSMLMSILDKQKVFNLHNVGLLSSIINNPSANKNVLIATLEAIDLHPMDTIYRNKNSYIDLVALIAAHPAADVEIFMELLNSRIKTDLISKQVLSNIIKHPSTDAGALITILNQVISNNKALCERAGGEHYYSVSADYLKALELIITSTKATLEIAGLVLNQILHDIELLGNQKHLIDLLKIIAEKASSDTLVLLLNKFFETNTLVVDEFTIKILLNKVARNPAATSEILDVILDFFKDVQDIESIQSISKLVQDRNTNAKNKLMPLLYARSIDSATFAENDVGGNLAFIIMQYHSFSNSHSILSSNGELKPFKAENASEEEAVNHLKKSILFRLNNQ
jgi:hypothetical protein